MPDANVRLHFDHPDQLKLDIELTPAHAALEALNTKYALKIVHMRAEHEQLKKRLQQVDDFLVTEWVSPPGPDGDYRTVLQDVVSQNTLMVSDPAVSSYANAANDLAKAVQDILMQLSNPLVYVNARLLRVSFDAWRDAVKAEQTSRFPSLRNRANRPNIVWDWILNTFGAEEATHVPQRGLRLVEEALEAGQAAGVTKSDALKVLDYVYSRPVGDLSQELGGVEVSMLGLAAAAGINAELAAQREVTRVLSKPKAYFRARNKAKNDAGLKAKVYTESDM